MTDRRRREIGSSDRACEFCGAPGLSLVESRAARRGWARINPVWRSHPRRYELCAGCGMRFELDG